MDIERNSTRAVRIGTVTIGDGNPIAIQSMTATHTQDVDATVEQVNALHDAGAMPPISAWWARLARYPISRSGRFGEKAGVITVTSGRWLPPL